MSQQKKGLKPGRTDRAPPPPSNPNFRTPTPAPFFDPNPYQHPPPPPPSASHSGREPSPPPRSRHSFLPPPPPPPPPYGSAPSSRREERPRRDDPSPFSRPPPNAPSSRRGQQQDPPPPRGGSAFNPTHEIATVSRAFSGVSLAAPVEERISAYDPRARPRTPRMGDIGYEEPLPYDLPRPSERTQPNAPRRSGYGTSSSQTNTPSGRAKGSGSAVPMRTLLPAASLPKSTSGTAHNPPSPPEGSEEAKRRKGTRGSKIQSTKLASSLLEQEPVQGHKKKVKDGPKEARFRGSRWKPAEDQALFHLREQYAADWKQISESMRDDYGFDRPGASCAARWSSLSTNPPSGPRFSAAEDKLLIQLVSEGLSWAKIHEQMVLSGFNRSMNSFQSHWDKVLKKKAEESGRRG